MIKYVIYKALQLDIYSKV